MSATQNDALAKPKRQTQTKIQQNLTVNWQNVLTNYDPNSKATRSPSWMP